MTRKADRWVAVLAAIACLSIAFGLADVALPRLVSAPLPPAPPGGRHDGALLVEVQAAGAPVAGAAVRVFWLGGQRWYLAASGRTDAGGQVFLEGLPRGTVWVVADGRDLARGSTQVVVEADPRRVALELFAEHTFRVGVRDEQGEPVVRATVLVSAADPLPFGALTGADGDALLRVGPPPWTVKVSARGYESVTRAGVREDVIVTLRPLASLEVRVEMADASPAAEAEVLIAGASLWPARRAVTDARGVATISGLLAGGYDLKASLGELVSETRYGFRVERGARATVTLRLGPGRMVPVIVTQGEDDSAPVVVGADVVLAEAGLTPFPLRGRTGADGKVTLGPIAAGPASVSASAKGFVPRGAVPVPEPLEGALRVPLLPGGTLAGRVVDSRGFPVDGATIEVIGTDLWGLPVAETPILSAFQRAHFAWALPGPAPLIPAGELGVMPGPVPPIPQPGQSEGAALAPAMQGPVEDVEPWVTRSDGYFEATPVTPGRVRAIVRHPAYVEGMSKVVQLPPGGRAEVEVVLRVGGTLEGRLVDSAGLPVAGARVDVSALRGTLERTTLTAADGTFAFAAVPAAVQLSVARPEDISRVVLKRGVEVPEAGRVEIEVVLPDAREPVAVKVLDDEGRPVDGAQVTLMSLDPAVPLRETLFTAADGSLAVEQARGLDLRVAVEATGFTRTGKVVERAPALVEVKLRRGVMITGKVTAVRGRQFAAGASVVLVAEGVRRNALTDAEGVFRFHDVPVGPVRLLVSHPEYASVEVDVVVTATERLDRPRELEPIDLEEAGAVEGEVVDHEGQPVLGARVAAGFVPAYLPAGALPAEVAVTDGKGRFTLGKLAPGPLELEAYHAQIGRGRIRTRVDAGRTLSGLKIRLEPAAAEDEPARPGGVAVTLGERNGRVVVVHVAEASEAERARLEAGDVIVSIDGATPSSLNDARERLAGAPGSHVVVHVRRGQAEERLHITRELVRR